MPLQSAQPVPSPGNFVKYWFLKALPLVGSRSAAASLPSFSLAGKWISPMLRRILLVNLLPLALLLAALLYLDQYQNGLLEADYIVVEMANQILGENWLPEYVAAANSGGIERVLV